MNLRTIGLVAAISAGLGGPALAQEGDAKAGKKVYKKCRACHVADKEKNKLGPHLVGIVGRKAGIIEKFKYSKALLKKAKEEELVWTPENLDKYLEAPKKFIKRGRMAFAGLRDPRDRADIIAYLATNTKK